MRFTISNKIFKRFYNLNVGILLIKNLDNKANDKIQTILKSAHEKARTTLQKNKLTENLEIKLWREAYSWMGAKPKKYKCSVEALLRRVLNDEDLPSINPIVDLYNAISLKYVLPIGGDNISSIEGDIKLTVAKGDEKFIPIGGTDSKSPSEGEVIYTDDNDVLCRRWNWREGDKTKLTEETKDIIIYIESLNGKENVQKAVDEFSNHLSEIFNITPDTFILDKENNGLEIDSKKLIKNNETIEEPTEQHQDSKRKKDKEKKERHMKAQGKDNKKIHWADKIALEVKQRIERVPKVKEIYDKHGLLVYDEKTPSGVIHIGSARGWLIHDLMARAMRDIGLKAEFVLSSDDMDPYDKPNKELDSSWDQHLGKPFRDIPSPVEGYKSFGDYFFSLVTEKFEDFGIKCGTESTGDLYCKGAFNPMIKKILDNSKVVQETYTSLYGETVASTRIPFNVKCPNCGKIATTLATEWDKEKELLTFECKKDLVEWAQGCGHKGQISPYDGNGKFPWKVEWAAKWPTKNVIAEWAGKDHFTHGGSRTYSCKLATDLLEYPCPWPSSGYKTGPGYEFFTIGGKKMSTSKGRGLSFRGASEILPMQIIRFLLVKTRPTAVVDFDPYQSNDLILLFDRFDKVERIYFGETEGVSPNEIDLQKRIYELSFVGDLPKKQPLQVSLSYAGIIMQVALNDIDKAIEIMKEQDHIPKEANDEDLIPIKERLKFAKHWIEDFAEEQYKFQLSETPDGTKLSNQEKDALKLLATKLKENEYDSKSLFEEFYNVCKEKNIKNLDFFRAAYLVLINKEKGPKLASFILTIGKEKTAKMFESI